MVTVYRKHTRLWKLLLYTRWRSSEGADTWSVWFPALNFGVTYNTHWGLSFGWSWFKHGFYYPAHMVSISLRPFYWWYTRYEDTKPVPKDWASCVRYARWDAQVAS